MDIKQLKKDRFNFLKSIYETVNGRMTFAVDGFEIGKLLNFERDYSISIYHYLNEEGLIEPMGAGIRLAITHQGIKEVEQALSKPDRPTEHFPPINQYNITIGEMSGGAIQQATSNSTINLYTTADEVIGLIKRFNEEVSQFINSNSNLPSDIIEEVKTDLATLEVQTASNKPKTEILKASIQSIKTISEGIVAGVITNILTTPQNLIDSANEILGLL